MRRTAGLVLVASALACASAGERAPPEPPGSFRTVRTLVLVRSASDRRGRPRDPLDGLEESLRARGYLTRVVELGREGTADPAGLDDLFGSLELRAGTPRGERFGATPRAAAGRAAGETVASLGVDAVASYHRLEGRRFLGTAPPSQAVPWPGAPASVAPLPATAHGAFALVDRRGQVAVFPWGGPGVPGDPEVPLNAAEAIDELLRVLGGEPGEAEERGP